MHHALRSISPSDITAVTVQYGQPHEKEVAFAKELCGDLGVVHHMVSAFPWNKVSKPVRVNDIPWSPQAGDPMIIRGRNSLLVAVAYIVAECDEIWLGCNSDDQRDYRDCRESWANAIAKVFSVTVRLPFCRWSKKEIVQMSRRYEINLDKTLSCYRGAVPGCGECNACLLRTEAMQ